MKRETTKKTKERIAYCLIDLFKGSSNSVTIPINVYCRLIEDTSINSGKKLKDEIFIYEQSDYVIKYPYSVRIITRDYVQAVLKIVNAQSNIVINMSANYDSNKHNQLISYSFYIDKECSIVQHLRLFFSQRNKELTINYTKFSQLLTKTRLDNSSTMLKIIQNGHKGNNKPISFNVLIDFTSDSALPVLRLLNELEANDVSHKKYTLITQGLAHTDTKGTRLYKTSYTYKTITRDEMTKSFIDTKKYISLKKSFPLECYKMSKHAYLIHVYIMQQIYENKTIDLFLAGEHNNKKTTYHIVEFDAKKVWDFWFNKTTIYTSYLKEFALAIKELKKLYTFHIEDSMFLLPPVKNLPFDEDTQKLSKITLYNPIRENKDKSYHAYIKTTNENIFKNPENITEYPKKLISISSKTSYSQIIFYELLYEYLPYDTEVTETHIDISLSDFVFKTGKIDIADWRFQNLQKKYAKTANWKCTVFNELLKTNQYKRFLSDLNRYFVEPTIDNINIYLKEAGINRRYTASFHINETDSPFIRFRLVLNDNIMD